MLVLQKKHKDLLKSAKHAWKEMEQQKQHLCAEGNMRVDENRNRNY
jgi:hypothetical protein